MKLRPIQEAELYQLFVWRNDPDVYKWCRQYEPLSWENHLRWFKSLAERQDVKMYAMEVDNPNKPITINGDISEAVGVCGLTDIDYINSRAEFSLYVGKEHWKKGLGSLGLTLLLDKAFKDLNLNQVWGESYAGNPAHHMFEKLGFEMTGIRPKHYYREGRYIDAMLFSIMREKWLSK